MSTTLTPPRPVSKPSSFEDLDALEPQSLPLARSADDRAPRTRERAGHRATLVLFGGIVALAIVGVVVSAVAHSIIGTRTAHAANGTAAATAAPQKIALYVAPSWKRGPDGQLHDAFSQTSFHVTAGRPVQLTIDNRDGAVHSITAAGAGVSIVVQPGKHTYTLLVRTPGRYKWICAYPCDPFSMSTVGYMQGYITAT